MQTRKLCPQTLNDDLWLILQLEGLFEHQEGANRAAEVQSSTQERVVKNTQHVSLKAPGPEDTSKDLQVLLDGHTVHITRLFDRMNKVAREANYFLFVN